MSARRWQRWLAACALLLAATAPLAAAPAPATHPPRAGSGVWYEIFVRGWYDTDGDGTGDLAGVTAKLDYLQSLGVDGIWLMPINPSPSYHGYDVTDYRAVNPDYGTLRDFRRLAAAAHRRGIRVIIDLVVNHTSDRHPWFLAARHPADPHHDWYTWAGPNTDLDARSATGGPAWHALGAQHYLGTFTGAMPDLDFDTPAVRAQVIRIGRFWLAQGADGFRLDAARHIYENFADQAGDPAARAKNVAWWRAFRRGLDGLDPHAFLVGEVTADSPRALAPYFGPLDAVFDFPLAGRLIDSAAHERAGGLGTALLQTQAAYRSVTGKVAVDAPFLSNHDQVRVMTRLAGDRRHMRMAAAMLLTLPGHPFLYYGEELGMRGDKPDPDLREPMRWHADPHGPGESRWKRFSAGDGPAVTVDAERDDPHSLLAWYRALIAWRTRHAPLRDGELAVPALADPHLAAWTLHDAGADLLVVHNLSGQPRDLPLSGPLVRYHRLAERTTPGTRVTRAVLHLPAYSSALLR